jgi:hypothetical protein
LLPASLLKYRCSPLHHSLSLHYHLLPPLLPLLPPLLPLLLRLLLRLLELRDFVA